MVSKRSTVGSDSSGGLRQRPTLVCVVLVVWAVLLWGCDRDATRTPVVVEPTAEVGTPNCDATILPMWTRVVDLDAGLAEVEGLAGLLVATCGAMWDDCCAPATLQAMTPELSATVVCPTPQATYTLYPVASEVPALCRRCRIGTQYGCWDGYSCRECDVNVWVCVRNTSLTGDCNFCRGAVMP